MGHAIKSTETRELRCMLTAEERQRRAERIAELLDQGEAVEAELAAARAGFKARIERCDLEKRLQLDEFRTGFATRPVECELRLDWDAGLASWVRTDTGEVLSERPLSAEERQRDLFEEQQREQAAEREEQREARRKRRTEVRETSGAAAL